MPAVKQSPVRVLYQSINMQAVHLAYAICTVKNRSNAVIMAGSFIPHELKKDIHGLLRASYGAHGINYAGSSMKKDIGIDALIYFCRMTKSCILQMFLGTKLLVRVDGDRAYIVHLTELIGRKF